MDEGTRMRASRIKQLATLSLLAMLLGSTACTTLRALGPDPAGAKVRAELHPGDTVQITLLNGTVHRFKVSQVRDSAISGDVVNSWSHATDPVGSHIDVPYSDIQVIEVARSSASKNTLLIVAGVVVVIAIVAAVATGGGQHSPGFSR
jgi:hypothetical protein